MKASPQEAAQGMLQRYSRPTVAAEMAHWHAMDYPEGSEQRLYWEEVRKNIVTQARRSR